MLTKMNQKKALDLIERWEDEKQPELWKNPLVDWNSHHNNSGTVFSAESINATNNQSIAVEIQNEKTDMIPILFQNFPNMKTCKTYMSQLHIRIICFARISKFRYLKSMSWN